jgi:hypothetical protein
VATADSSTTTTGPGGRPARRGAGRRRS